jgi:hypothetical protein
MVSMNCYGKKWNELTELEKELQQVDTFLCLSMEMNLKGESLISSNPNFGITSGTHEDICDKFYRRMSIISEILNIENPDEKTIFDIISGTQYNIQNFCVDYSTRMGRPNDIYYHYCVKYHEEMEPELV